MKTMTENTTSLTICEAIKQLRSIPIGSENSRIAIEMAIAALEEQEFMEDDKK